MTEEIKLKPCPFCGGEAEIIDDAMGTISRCRRCGAENGNGVYGVDGHKLAVKDWNSRPIEDAQDKEIKRLREALEKIKNTVEDAQDAVYPFHIALDSKDGLYILEVTKEALKGREEC